MMIAGRIQHLEKQHVQLDHQIDILESTGRFTDDQMQTLKRERLAIRDELNQLRRHEYNEHQELDFDDDRR